MDLKTEKQRANKLLTTKLKDILLETTEVESGEDGQPVLITKAEALARLVVRMALGYKEEIEKSRDGKTVVDTVVHPPHVGMIALVYDRLEGRIPIAKDDEGEKQSLATRVTEQGKQRINAAGQIKPNSETPSA